MVPGQPASPPGASSPGRTRAPNPRHRPSALRPTCMPKALAKGLWHPSQGWGAECPTSSGC
eukprot:4775847-Heterocapsa_arctica.AAC.1